MKRISETQKKIIARLYELGYGFAKIAQVVGCNQVTAQKAARNLGIPVRNRNNNSKPEEDIEVVYDRLKKEYMEVINEVPINCDKQGKRCVYRARPLAANKCDYCLKMGKMRGGSPEECYKYCF